MKMSLKRILSTLLAVVLLLLAAPIAGLCTPFASNVSAMETENNSYAYLHNYIDTLGNEDENGYNSVNYWTCNIEGKDIYTYFTNNTEFDNIELFSEMYINDYSSTWAYLNIGLYDSVYEMTVGCTIGEEVLNGYCVINPSTFDPERPNVNIELVNVPDGLANNKDVAYELLESVVPISIGGIEIALENYADISLGNFGFAYFDDYTMPILTVELNGLYRDSYGWKYYTDNEIDTEFVGLEANNFGVWYISNGTIDFSYNGLFGDEYGDYVIKNGQIDESADGLIKLEGKWLYADSGYIDCDYEGLAKNAYGWWYVKDGTIDFSYTGMAKNRYGWWYVQGGKLNGSYTGLAKNPYGWWYFNNGSIDYKFDGLAKNQYGWWYIKNGTINYKFKGLAKNQYGWWYVKNGTIDFSYNGTASNKYGTWKVVNGKVVTK